MTKKPRGWKKWIDIEFKDMSFDEIFGSVKDLPKKKKGKKGIMADIELDIGV